MARKATNKREPKGKTTRKSLAKDIWLAALGACSLAEEEATAFVKKLVERGSLSGEEGKNLLDELKAKLKSGGGDIGRLLEIGVSKTLERFNIPSKDEIRELTRKVDELVKKMDTFRSK